MKLNKEVDELRLTAEQIAYKNKEMDMENDAAGDQISKIKQEINQLQEENIRVGKLSLSNNA